ncbi:COBRA-like protein 6 [Cinnamomum micranthum f. kanehirae]|uniref:COBRA-like protein n=1 Tax=Cinnamomum micranthum f. kanehirae TaxID=337451 RepID=A0A443NJ78_9MAGN|nr:COBRA-like protein 6 [Cinnamomum micranthum f. kanehirae]
MGRYRRKPTFHLSFYDLLVYLFFLVIIQFSAADAYDPMDPKGNITVKWDIVEWHDDTYTAEVTIFNFQLYRHVEMPGWRFGWAWKGKEVIWKMWGAEATEQGNCSMFSGGNIPHCCERKPVIIDLLSGTAYKDQYYNCCKGGVLSSITQDPSKFASSFKLVVGNAHITNNALIPPENFTLGVPGYTCGPAYVVPPSRYSDDGGRRWQQALATWSLTCSYSQFMASRSPRCCVSMSSFYNSTIVPCPLCSCSCQGLDSAAKCVKPDQLPTNLQMPNSDGTPNPVVMCTRHMCPIHVHWHVKVSYKKYWRVKVTVTNLNYAKNFSEWNLVVQHPNLQSVEQVFSFNYKPLHQYGSINDSGMFWGIKFYNDMLLHAGKLGNAQTEILLRKDPGIFTFNQGWAFPRRISFNGDDCVMPPPDTYPMLPNGSPTCHLAPHFIYFASCLFFFFFLVL